MWQVVNGNSSVVAVAEASGFWPGVVVVVEEEAVAEAVAVAVAVAGAMGRPEETDSRGLGAGDES